MVIIFFTIILGLHDCRNVSTVEDMIKLSLEVWKCPLQREIVKTKEYSARVYRSLDQSVLDWENTNRLLFKNNTYCIGIKTGITKQAGPCLSSVFVKEHKHILCIVLHSKFFYLITQLKQPKNGSQKVLGFLDGAMSIMRT